MENRAEKIPRRSFLAHLGGVCLAGHSLLGCAAVPVHYAVVRDGAVFLSDNQLNELFRKGNAGLLQGSDLPEAIVLLRGGEPPLQALGATCPHQGCQVRPREHFLICPCHGSTFNRAGEPTRGPAQNPLNRYDLELVEGGVRLRVG